MATITFFTRTTKTTNPDKKINVRVRFRHGKKINIYAKSGLEVLPHFFSNETHTINKRAKYSDKDDDKKYLDDLESEILNEFKKLKDFPTSDWLNLVIDKYRFPEKYLNNNVPTLFEFIEQFIKEAPFTPRRSNDTLPSKKTILDYSVTFENLKEFAKYKRKNDFRFVDLDITFYNDFKNFLAIKKGYALNTVGKKIKVLVTFLNDAEYRGYIDKSAFKGFKKLSEVRQAVYLNEKELQKIYNLNLKGTIGDVRDLFLIGCWTGLRYSDWNKITPENITGDKLTIIQAKTGNTVVVPLLKVTKAILKKHDYKLPKIVSNQGFNEYLKKVAYLAKIKDVYSIKKTVGGAKETIMKPKWELITTHTARRSFATNMYLSKYSIKSIMDIMGFETESVFMSYLKLTKEESANAILKKEQEIETGKNKRLKVV